MKTLEDIKDDYAREHGYDDWNEVIYSFADPDLLDRIYDRIARRFAKEVAKQALKNASENATLLIESSRLDSSLKGECGYVSDNNDHIEVDKESILNENNIPKL